MSNDLVQVDDLHTYLKLTEEFTLAQEATAQQLLDGAASAVVEYCGWHIAPAVTATVTVDGSGAHVQMLPTLALSGVESVTECGVDVDADDYDWSKAGYLLRRSGAWTSRLRGIVAEITHGHAVTPPWLVTLICAAAGRAWSTTPGVAAESSGGESVTYAQAAPGTAGAVHLLEAEYTMLDRLALEGRP